MYGKTSVGVRFKGLVPVLILLGMVTFACSRSESPPPQPTQSQKAVTPEPQPQQPQTQATPSQTLTPPPVTASPQQTAPSPGVPQTTLSPPATPVAPGPQNFAEIQVGMGAQEVLQIMGNPAQVKQEHGGVEWEYYTAQGGKVEIYLQNDRVVRTKSKSR